MLELLYKFCFIGGGLLVKRKLKGFTFIELLISVLVISMALMLAYMLSTKITNESVERDYNSSAFYNNMSALDILEKTLDETGDITQAVAAAYEETEKRTGRYKQDMEIVVEEIIIYDPAVDIATIDPYASPVDEDNDGEIDYYKNGDILYYAVQTMNSASSVSQHLPVYRVTINTTVKNYSRTKNEIRVLVSPNKGIVNY